jgi:zinc transporter, ZIP family
MHANFLYALTLSAIASMATVLGSVIAMVVKRPGPKLMAFALGFSAGVMMFVSFAEMLASSIHDVGFLPAVIAFFGGTAVMFAIDLIVPHLFISEQADKWVKDGSEACLDTPDGPGNRRGRGPGRGLGPGRHRHQHGLSVENRTSLMRAGLLIALGIGIHNLPEGMATFAGAIKDRGLGLAIAGAIALHNIPEGLAVGLPVFCATGSKSRAFWLAALSGGAELFGALLAAAVLMPFLTPTVLSLMLAAVAGLMVFISFDELIPGSYAYRFEHLSVIGITSGMALMALSIWLLR